MKTHTIAEAREKLPSLLKRARKGEDIGIISGNTIIQLKPVDVDPQNRVPSSATLRRDRTIDRIRA
jgi:antitoxin (DNA-binding transcriptional repressor) of toxin-antitoxin stability system